MIWARNNKFLAGFFVFVVIAVLTLGYFLYTSYSGYSDVSDSYEKEATELVRLQNLPLYPNNENLMQYKAQRDLYAKALTDLRTTLASWNRRLQPMAPQQFQEELKESAADFNNKAAAAGLKVPPNFYLGFDAYRDSPPNPDAASPLDRQLKGVEIILNQLLEAKVSSIVSVNRTPLVEESGAEQPTAGKGAKAGGPLVSYYPYQVEFSGGQNQFRRFLNDTVRNKDQFFVVRTVSISNSKSKSPPRAVEVPEPPGTAPTAHPDGPAGTAADGSKTGIEFVLGKETVTVVMRIDIVEFTMPTPGT